MRIWAAEGEIERLAVVEHRRQPSLHGDRLPHVCPCLLGRERLRRRRDPAGGSGALRLDIPAGASITDLVGNSLSGLPYTSGAAYMVRPNFIFLPLVLRNTP